MTSFASCLYERGAEKWVPKVQEATRTATGKSTHWIDMLGSAVHAARVHEHAMDDLAQKELDRFHEPLAFAATGKAPQMGPRLRLTGTSAPKLSAAEVPSVCLQSSVRSCSRTDVQACMLRTASPDTCTARRSARHLVPRARFAVGVQDLRMCETCYKVATGMHSCNGCHHAWYCGATCQREGWKSGHKRRCRTIAGSLGLRGHKPSHGVFLLPMVIGAMLQARLCFRVARSTVPGTAIRLR